jgi:hypothetical protein
MDNEGACFVVQVEINKTLTRNFNYFNKDDSIRLYGRFGKDRYVYRTVSEKTERSLTLDSAILVDPKSQFEYHALRMSVDFTKPKYEGICNKRVWAKSNRIQWDGVSNYNKCK